MSVDDELVDRFLDGDVSDDETALVIQWLESTASLQRFAKRAELHADLRSSLRRRGIQCSAMEACEPTALAAGSEQQAIPAASAVGSQARAMPVVIAISVAASLLIAFLMWSKDIQPDSSRVHLATIVSRVDALLTDGKSNWDRAKLVAGEYQLRRGLLHLQFDGGVMVYVEAPARFNVVSGKRLVLQHGRLSASVPPEGIGFTVDTPEAEVVDFGTEFSVDVESGTSEVHVFDGLVRVQPRPAQNGVVVQAVNLRTSEAVKVEGSTQTSSKIELATQRFIRSFSEPKRNYLRSLKQLSPVALYRMGIRDLGLVSQPPQYSGEVLTDRDSVDAESRPPHARGVFAGGSLRVGAGSTGRGGRVTTPPPLETGQFSLVVFVYLETGTPGGLVTTNFHDDKGNFALSIDEQGLPRATVRDGNSGLHSVISNEPLPLTTWRHIVVTADGDQLRLYEDGQLVSTASCESVAHVANATLWFGTNAGGIEQFNGRIDELALFDKSLSDAEIAELYQAAMDEIASTE